MLLKYLVLYIFSSISFLARGQKKVNNEAFNTMLQSLLNHSVNEVTPKDFDTSTEVIFLDAREKKEYSVSHLPNAKWVGYDSFKMRNLEGISKKSEIVVYCTVGYRSEKIAEKLVKLGYTNVSNLYGGIFEWIHNGKNVMSDSITKNVHTYNKEWSHWLNKNAGNKIY